MNEIKLPISWSINLSIKIPIDGNKMISTTKSISDVLDGSGNIIDKKKENLNIKREFDIFK